MGYLCDFWDVAARLKRYASGNTTGVSVLSFGPAGRRIVGCVMAVLALLLSATHLACVTEDEKSQVIHSSITHDGLDRTFRLYVPASYYEKDSAPLVVVLHGSGSTGDDMATLADFESIADGEGFLVVFPDAYEENWNDGRAVSGIAAYDQNIDDVGFIAAMIDTISNAFAVDSSRIYVTGMSNGSMMAYRLACELAPTFAACAPVAGSIPENIFDSCEPSISVPFVIFNGTDDPYVPWDGGSCGTEDVPLGTVVSIADSVQFWAAHNGCDTEPVAEVLADLDPDDGTIVAQYTYTGADAQDDVVFYGIDGGGHTWPGGPAIQTLWNTGPVSYDIDATDIIWEFFKEHQRS